MNKATTRTNEMAIYDEKILNLAIEAAKKNPGGILDLDAARSMFSAVKDGGKYTDTEKATMLHVRTRFNWTREADEWFRTEMRKWAAAA